jgi:hypothetical protein
MVLLGFQVAKRILTFLWQKLRGGPIDPAAPEATQHPLWNLGKGLLMVGVIILPWAVFAQWTFGSVFPHTLQNKMWQGRSGFWGHGWVYFNYFYDHLFRFSYWDRHGLIATVLNWWTAQDWWTRYLGISPYWYRYGMVLPLWGVLLVIRDRSAWLGPVVFVAVQQAAYLLLNVPGYHWYFSVLDGLLFILGVYGICGLLSLFRATRRLLYLEPSKGTASDMAGFALLSLFLICGLGYGVYDAAENPAHDDRDNCYTGAIREINEGDYPAGPLASLEVGTLGYYTDRTMVDLLGLTSTNPEYITPEHLDQFFADPPAVILMRDPPGPFLKALANDSRFQKIYGEGKPLIVKGYAFRLHWQVSSKHASH